MIKRIASSLRQRSGTVLVTAIIASGIVASIGVVMMNRATASIRQAQQSVEQDQSWYLAMAGIEHCMARLRWDGTVWTDLMNGTFTQVDCEADLNGGHYDAAAVKTETDTVRIESTGTFGRFSKTLISIAEMGTGPGNDGTGSSLAGGGSWRFLGNTTIRGTIVSYGTIRVNSNSTTHCGTMYSVQNITLPSGWTAIPQPDPCDRPSGIYPNWTGAIVPYSDAAVEPILAAGPDVVGNLTCKAAEGSLNCPPYGNLSTLTAGKDSLFVSGIVYFENDNPRKTVTIPASIKTIVADGFSFRSDVLESANFAGVKLYTLSEPVSGSFVDPDCTKDPLSGTLGALTKVRAYSNTIINGAAIWAPTGWIQFDQNSEMSGKVYGQCVLARSTWTYTTDYIEIPPPPAPGEDEGGSPTSGTVTLRLLSLYEP